MTKRLRRPSQLDGVPTQLLGDVRQMIEEARAPSHPPSMLASPCCIGESAGESVRRY